MQALRSGCYWSRWALKLYWSWVSQPVSLWRKALLILLVKWKFLKGKAGKNRQLNSRGHREGAFCFHTVLFFLNVSLFLFSAFFLYKGLYLCVYFIADWTRFFQEFNSISIYYFIQNSSIQSNHTLGCRSHLNSCFHPNIMFFYCFQLKLTHLIQFVKCKPISVVVKAGMLV